MAVVGGGGVRDRAGRLGVVSIVAVLVWLWAARATTEQDTIDSVVTIDLPSAEAKQERELLSPAAPFTVRLLLSGPTSDLDRAEKRLRQVALVTGAGGVPEGISNHDLDIRNVLQGVLDEARIDVTVVRADGEVPPVDVDEVASATVPITPTIAPPSQFEGDPVAQPTTAIVRMPRKLREQAGALRLDARIDGALVANRETGRQYAERVPLTLVPAGRLDPGARVRIIPEYAIVTYALAASTATTVIGAGADPTTAPGVPVQVALPTKDLDRYTIAIDDRDGFLRNVVLSGPTAQIDQIAQGKVKVIAFVQLTSDDLDRALLDGGTIVRPVTLWQLPPGVTVVNPGKTDGQTLAEREPERARRDGILIEVRRRAGS